ncbi:SGNH/GDSL hydrolase family protein [bacterium]|nr:SGNH/GDSL hydrolase family protein [candidate division CSSED10-310 bacterium]
MTRNRKKRRPRKPLKRRLLFAAIWLLFLLLTMEAGFRIFFGFRYGTFWVTYPKMIMKIYPETTETFAYTDHKATEFNVLLLVASVFHPDFGNVTQRLHEKLLPVTGDALHLWNFAQGAHTTRDSLIKYRAVSNIPADVAVIYHGINDLRANNIPPEYFKPDYGHFGWYDYVNGIDRYRSTIGITAIPYGFHYLYTGFKQMMFRSRYIPHHTPLPKWQIYGADIKTAGPFESNLREILDMARQHRTDAILMTYAYYVPDNYSFGAFKAKYLDYQAHDLPIELWGQPKFIIEGLDKHNAIIQRLATEYSDVHFIDMEKKIPKDGRYFDDICHLSEEGCDRFTDILSSELITIYRERHPH